MRLEARDEHEQAQVRALFRSVFEEVDAQLDAGAMHLAADSATPEEGEVFRVVVTSDLLPEPKVISVRNAEND